jgi:hypothetical protein
MAVIGIKIIACIARSNFLLKKPPLALGLGRRGQCPGKQHDTQCHDG